MDIKEIQKRIDGLPDEHWLVWYPEHSRRQLKTNDLKALCADHTRLQDELADMMQFFGIEKLEDGTWRYSPASMRKFRKSQNDTEYEKLQAKNAAMREALEMIAEEMNDTETAGDMILWLQRYVRSVLDKINRESE